MFFMHICIHGIHENIKFDLIRNTNFVKYKVIHYHLEFYKFKYILSNEIKKYKLKQTVPHI